MEIEEIPNKNPINVRAFKFSCDCKDKSIPAPLPNTYNHFLCITAKPKQGKTTLIYNCCIFSIVPGVRTCATRSLVLTDQ